MISRHQLGAMSLALLGLSFVSQSALGQERERDPEALGTHQKNVRLEIGARTQFVSSDALDPFSENDVLPQLALGASYAFYAQERLSIAAVLGFDYGKSSSHARDIPTSLDLRRFTLGPEVRYHVLRILAVTAKLAPTLTREAAEADTGLGTDLAKVAWKFGLDATAGAAVELFGYHSGESRVPRLWLTAEGGYGWTAPTRLVLTPKNAGDAPERLTPLDWGELSLAGPLFRITAALSFR